MGEDGSVTDGIVLSVVKRTKIGLSAPYFFTSDEIRDVQSMVVADGPGRSGLLSDVVYFVTEAEKVIIQGLKGRDYSERELAKAVFGKGTSAELGHLMLQYLLLDRLAFASTPRCNLPALKQSHYVAPKQIPENLKVAVAKYENWPGTWQQFCQDYTNTYGLRGACNRATSDGPANSNSPTPEPGQLDEIISGIVGAAEVTAAKSKVHSAENNFLYAALGLNALMLVSE